MRISVISSQPSHVLGFSLVDFEEDAQTQLVCCAPTWRGDLTAEGVVDFAGLAPDPTVPLLRGHR